MKAFLVTAPRSTALRALNYNPEAERLRTAKSRESRPLREYVADFGRAYGTMFARIDCDPKHGVELLSQADMFAAEPRGRVIRESSMPQSDLHRVTRGDVLFAGAGTLGETELYGRALIADGRLEGKYVGQDSLRLRFHEPDSDDALFAYAFLASPTGVRLLRSTSYGTKLLRFRKALLDGVNIPVPDKNIRTRVAALIRKTMAGREAFHRQTEAARHVLSSLPEVAEAQELCSRRVRRTVSWKGPFPTLCAWQYASTGGALELLSRRWSARLRDVVETDGIYNGPRFARIPCLAPHGVQFYSQRHAFLVRPIPRRIAHPGFADRMLLVREGTILIASHGTLGEGEIFGRATFAYGKRTSAAFTQDLLRVVPSQDSWELVFAFLTTELGFRLLRSTGVGTKLLSMRPDLLRELPFPEVSPEKRKTIKRHVHAAAEARETSDASEVEAIRIVEEEVLPKWLA